MSISLHRKILQISILLLILPFVVNAQFYNGHQMTFGKNRVQYGDYVWQFYRFKKFDTYFHEGGVELAQYVSKYAYSKVNEYEDYFEYALENRIIFVVFSSLSDFRQSNIGLSTEGDQYNVGGTTKIIDNKVFIYFDGNHKKLEEQISAAIAEVIINEYLVGNDLKSRVANSTLIALPEWYTKGLISYLSKGWDFEIENKVKDGILNGKYEKFNKLTGEDAISAGHSIWYYIASRYGKNVIPNILYLTRVSKNTDSGFMYVLGTSLKYLTYDWLHFYDELFYNDSKHRNIPEENNILKRSKNDYVYDNIKISPDGKFVAYSSNVMGRYKIWLYDTETGKTRKILRKEHKLDQITDYSYPVIGWHPSGQIFAYFIEEKGKVFLYMYNMGSKKTDKREIIFFNKVLDFDYSKDGFKMVLSATRKGQSDIYIYNIAANSINEITQDLADDLNPRYYNNSTGIIFSSNRINDTIVKARNFKTELAENYNIFIYDLNGSGKELTQLTKTPYINEKLPFNINENLFSYISDDNGIFNRHIATYDSTIAFIDTSTHYTYFTISSPLTNYNRNILVHDINPAISRYAEIIYSQGKYKLLYSDFSSEKNSYYGKYKNTPFRNKMTKEQMKAEQDAQKEVEKIKKIIKAKIDSSGNDTTIDINNYVFEKEKVGYDFKNENPNNKLVKDTTDTIIFELPKQRYYFTSFYTNYLVNQIDFNFLNQTYQAYSGSAVYYNPNFSLLFKLGTNDLMEDYRITGGFRIAGNLNSNEYLLSFENLKKRIDKQIIFHRLGFQNVTTEGDLLKTHTHELMYIFKYPFNQVARFNLTTSARYDRTVHKALESIQDLQKENVYKTWIGLKGEYVFDNTRNLGINLYDGTRYKLFAEAFKQIGQEESDLFVLGFDYRQYIKIHRSLIFATRFAGSTSFGNSLLVYYLGSVDNWINLSTKKEKFDSKYLPDINKNWEYQTLATNMRGFTQNIRHGNNFLLMNNEIRWPIIRYFANRPLNSDFLNSMQVVGFFDIGTAWTGSSPLSDENTYNRDVYNPVQGPVQIIVDNEKDPFVYGFGAGVRSRLLGYFIRADWAWGVDSGVILPRIFYLSLSLDF